MVTLAPFKGIKYNKEKIPHLEDVMSPPYDIITPEMQQKLYKKHKQNYVRLILGKQNDDDTKTDNRYTCAQQLFSKWQQDRILIQSEHPCIYPYTIEYTLNGKAKTMTGFFVLVQIDPTYTTVKPHEKTLSKPKQDRLSLMRACHANLEPIQLLYTDPKNTITDVIHQAMNQPIVNVEGYDGFTHKLYQITDEKVIQHLLTFFSNQDIYIADGHHRYQTAINFAQERREETNNDDPHASFNYRLIILVNMFDEGLAILPTHRLITYPDLNVQQVLSTLSEHFSIQEYKFKAKQTDPSVRGNHIMEEVRKQPYQYGLYAGGKYYLLKLKESSVMKKITPDHSETWQTLDVSILHKLILEKGMDITDENLEDHVKYTRSNKEAIQWVDDGTYDFSFLLNATQITQLKQIADNGEHMPQKSTYFLPKMLSGLIAYKME